MKLIPFICYFIMSNASFAQSALFEKTKHWKIYDISEGNLFRYGVDTLKSFQYEPLDEDSIHFYLNGISELSSNEPPLWMGLNIASYEFNGMQHKVDISQYGGFFFDESSKRYYQIASDKKVDWNAYIRRTYMRVHSIKK